ncbi:MAG: acetyl-CoA carboxylase biotin carboxyl carrier protein [Leptospirales bacterium]
MTNSEIQELLALLQSTNVTVFELEQEGTRIKIQKSPLLISEGLRTAPYQQHRVGDFHSGLPSERTPAPEATVTTHRTITAPIVGTFYRSASPESAPYVEIGSPVQKGQILCIIEAMKLMNEIESEFDGVVRAIFLENGQSVEFGMPLIEIEPTVES